MFPPQTWWRLSAAKNVRISEEINSPIVRSTDVCGWALLPVGPTTIAATAKERTALIVTDNVFLILESAVETALNEAATKVTKELRERFEHEMIQAKREVISKLVEHIQISATQDMPSGEYVIQIRLNGGAGNG